MTERVSDEDLKMYSQWEDEPGIAIASYTDIGRMARELIERRSYENKPMPKNTEINTKTLGEVAHDAGAFAGRWQRKWSDLSDEQRIEWEAIAEAVINESEERGAENEYKKANPLGGPATMFETIARRIRAGEDHHSVLVDYGVTVSQRDYGVTVSQRAEIHGKPC